MFINVVTKALAIWFVILVLAIVNGTLRETVLIPLLGTTFGLVFSGVLLSLLILAVTYYLLPWLGIRRLGQLFFIGFCWLILTLIFEFSFGLLLGKALPEIIEAYTFKDGNLWPAILVVMVMAPWLSAKFRGWL